MAGQELLFIIKSILNNKRLSPIYVTELIILAKQHNILKYPFLYMDRFVLSEDKNNKIRVYKKCYTQAAIQNVHQSFVLEEM